MKKQTFGAMLAALRKEKGMTQLELAEQMGVTDKAVSKWERDLSFPDVTSLPRLAEILEVSVDELMQGKVGKTSFTLGEKVGDIVDLALKGVAVAMGVAVAVLSILNQIGTGAALGMLGIGLACLAISQLSDRKAAHRSKDRRHPAQQAGRVLPQPYGQGAV